MDTAYSQHLSRISKMLLAAAGVAFAWVLLSIALGFSASQANAEEDPGLLGSVTGVVEDTASGATGVVEDTADGVTGVVQDTSTTVEQTAAPVVETVSPAVQPVVEAVAPIVAPAAAAVPVAPVVEAVEAAVAPVVSTVGEITGGGVVAPTVDTVVGIVGAVPVVGGVVSGLGVDTAASSVGSSVDGVLQGTTGAVAGTVADVVDTAGGVVTAPVRPMIPVLPGTTDAISVPQVISGPLATAAASSAHGPTAAVVVADPFTIFSRAAYMVGVTALTALVDTPGAVGSSDAFVAGGAAAEGLLTLLRSVMQADSVLIGPGGAGPGAWVLVALGFVVAYRAWMRRSGLENDVAPAAPTLSTDVSPD